jgi:hypothetical protein
LNSFRSNLGIKQIIVSKSKLKIIMGKTRLVFLFGCFQGLVFFPALSNTMPWSDDWGYIYFVNDNNRNIFHDAMAAGRPILGFVDQFAYQNTFIVNNLVILQLLSLIALLFLQLAIYSKSMDSGFGQHVSLLVSLAFILMPGIQGYVYFLSCFPYSWACLFGYLSYGLINSKTRYRASVGFIFFVVSFLIYPAGAMFYFLGYFFEFISRFKQESNFRSNLTHLLRIFSKMTLCSAAGVLIARIVRSIYGIDQAARIEVINSLESLVDKAVWTTTRLFVSEFRVFSVASPSPSRAAIEVFVLFLLFVIFILRPTSGLTWNRALNFSLLLIIPLLGALPNLLILENQFEFRTLTPTFAMSLVLWAFCLDQILNRFLKSDPLRKKISSRDIKKVMSFVCGLLLIVIVSHVQRDSTKLWITPSLNRDAITLESLRNLNAKDKNSICMVIPEQLYVPQNKLGVYSMRSDLVSSWVPEPYMKQQLMKFNLNDDRKITVVTDKESCDPSGVLIDYSDLLGRNL